jgi:predicted ATP-grasp superfamily ATP-dependent carboligase
MPRRAVQFAGSIVQGSAVCQTAVVDTPDFVEIERLPKLRSPTVIAAFRGWNDAGASASLACTFLRDATAAERFAVIDCDPFVDYQQTRPQVSLDDGYVRHIEWPVTELYADEQSDVVLVLGTEPNLRWRAFSDAIAQISVDLGAELTITLGALLADTPHTRPVPVSSTGSDEELIARFGLTRSNYAGPTGIVGVLHDACARRGIRSASLWAATPHYISATPNPSAAVALLDRLHELVGTPQANEGLRRMSGEYQVRVAAAIADDEDVLAYVAQLEEQADEDETPSGEELAEKFEQFLREQGTDEPGQQ